MTKKVAIMKGDGIGPEIVDAMTGMYRMMQHETSDNFVLATNRAVTVKRFTELAFEVIGTEIIWEGAGVKEKGIDKKTGEEIVKVSEKYFRLAEVDALIGSPAKAEKGASEKIEKITSDCVMVSILLKQIINKVR